MSDLNNFFNNNSDNNNNNNNNNSIDDFYNPSPNQELEIEDNRNLVDAPDTNYNRQINDNSNFINTNNLPNARLERDYHFEDETDKKTIIKNVILILIVVIVGFFLVYNYSGVKKSSSTEGTTPVEETPTQQDTPIVQETPTVEQDGTVTHSDDEVYLEVSTSRPVAGSGIEQIGKEKFYKTDINREINSNGVSFIIKEVSNKGVKIVLNTDLNDTSASVGCRKNLCTAGTEITLDGKITVIFETLDKENRINYSFNVYNIKY